MSQTDRPEREMVRRALVPGAVAAALAFILGYLFAGGDTAASASLGVAVVVVNFAAHGYSLAWAAGISVAVVQVVALAGFAVRLGIIVGLMFLLDGMAWFSALAFGLAVVPATLVLLVYEALLVVRGMGSQLDIPPDPAAARAAERLAAREASR